MTVSAINEELTQARREKALLSIDSKLAEVQAKLKTTGANADVSNKALRPLQDIKARLASQTSIAQILLLQGTGGDAMDDAINLIEASTAKVPHQVAAPGDTTKPVQSGHPNVPSAAPKTTRVINAAEFSSKAYLETEPDVDAFVTRLKDELLTTVRAGQMVRIR